MKKFILIIFLVVNYFQSNSQSAIPPAYDYHCLVIPETTENPSTFNVYLEQMSELNLASDSVNVQVFRIANMGPFGIEGGIALYKIEKTETNCIVSIKLPLQPKIKYNRPHQLIVYVWTYDPSVWEVFEKMADSIFYELPKKDPDDYPVHDGSSTVYEYRNKDRYHVISRSPRSRNHDEIPIRDFIRKLTGPMYGEDCN